MKIEAGKEYKTRDSGRARVYATDGEAPYPIHGAILRDGVWRAKTWALDGQILNPGQNINDLVSEWKNEPLIPFNFWTEIMPAWVNYVAMDSGGMWYAHIEEPMMQGYEWNSCGSIIEIPKGYIPSFSGDWKQSLIKRP